MGLVSLLVADIFPTVWAACSQNAAKLKTAVSTVIELMLRSVKVDARGKQPPTFERMYFSEYSLLLERGFFIPTPKKNLKAETRRYSKYRQSRVSLLGEH